MNYALIRPLLFMLPPEVAHYVTLKLLRLGHQLGTLHNQPQGSPFELWGLKFPNRIGLAAGLDKNGDYIDALGALGFGFIEVGTVTPQPQTGNPKPRLYRLKKHEALINRMGFNNKGVDYLLTKVRQRTYTGILGINIGKNAVTPIETATDDYLLCLRKVYPYASYITVNISSPNTLGLRELQGTDYLASLVQVLKHEQQTLQQQHQRFVPLVVKVAPDLTAQEVVAMANIFMEQAIDGIIVTNTALARPGVTDSPLCNQPGGLSGAPIFDLANSIMMQFHQALSSKPIPIIASGGVMAADNVKTKLAMGASLVQLYTGLIYRGPALIKEAIQAV